MDCRHDVAEEQKKKEKEQKKEARRGAKHQPQQSSNGDGDDQQQNGQQQQQKKEYHGFKADTLPPRAKENVEKWVKQIRPTILPDTVTIGCWEVQSMNHKQQTSSELITYPVGVSEKPLNY